KELTTNRLHGVALRTRTARACSEHRQKEVALSSCSARRRHGAAHYPRRPRHIPLEGLLGRTLHELRSMRKRCPLVGGTGHECEIPWSAESIASSLLSGIGGQLANVAICRKMVSQ